MHLKKPTMVFRAGWSCFEKAELKGIVTGGGIGDANDASNHEAVMMKAYELGKAL